MEDISEFAPEITDDALRESAENPERPFVAILILVFLFIIALAGAWAILH